MSLATDPLSLWPKNPTTSPLQPDKPAHSNLPRRRHPDTQSVTQSLSQPVSHSVSQSLSQPVTQSYIPPYCLIIVLNLTIMAFASCSVIKTLPPINHVSATPSKKRTGSPSTSVRDRTVVVFDWDDTLCPSSWLHAHDLLPKYRGHQISVTPEQREVLNFISAHVARLLQKAVAYGPVFVVTAAEYGWVEMSAALYLPDVQSVLALADVHIVSARSWYEQTFGLGGDSAAWKQEVMQLIARKCFAAAAAQETNVNGNRTFRQATTTPRDAYFNFLSIGDSMAERDACFAAVENVCRTFAKTLKFIEHPTAEEVLQQVELTYDSFEQMCGWDNNLDLRLSRAQLAELRGSPI